MIDRDKFKPFVLLFLCMAASVAYFWMSSRYPDLGAKATLGASAPLSGLGFAPLIEILPDAPLWEKLFYGTLNWLDTNRRGMTFSFILSAFFLSLIPLLNIRRVKSSLGNAMTGLMMGMPLGLCVNCTAPVARSMQASGMRPEAALAMLISSPTMNVLVLSMAFTFFPFYLVIGKLFLTLVFVLVVIPLSFRIFFKKEALQDEQVFGNCDDASCEIPEIIGWWQAICWCVFTYVKNFMRIVIITGPLMVVAGFIGTVLINFLPWSEVKSLGVTMHDPITVGFIMLLIAIVGAILPAPMAFDVAMSAFLLQAGVPIEYVAVFLFTLGAYSVYAFFIVWQAISLRVSAFLFLITLVFGIILGGSTFSFERYYLQKATENVETAKGFDDLDPIIQRKDREYSLAEIRSQLDKGRVDYIPVLKEGNINVEFMPFAKNDRPEIQLKPFTLLYGDDLGIEQPYRISYITGLNYLPRNTSSVSTGDVHHDGWEDLLVLGDSEVSPNLVLYANISGNSFKRQKIPFVEDAVLVALVDLDGDGWLDIIYATYSGKNFVIYNDKGEFLEKNKKQLGQDITATTNSMAFGDFDKNGDLEIFLGNWNVGPDFLNYSLSKNILLTLKDGSYQETILPGLTGETLSSLIWDFNKDGNPDLYIGNDFVKGIFSDLILLGDGNGNFTLPDKAFVKRFKGAQTTMSIDVSDVNNDLNPEFYISQIALFGQHLKRLPEMSKRQIPFDNFCEEEEIGYNDKQQCKEDMNFKLAISKISHFNSDSCEAVINPLYKKMCNYHLMNYRRYCAENNLNIRNFNSEIVKNSRYLQLCQQLAFARDEEFKNQISKNDISFHVESANESKSNILLSDEEAEGWYKDIGIAKGVGYGGWSWNSKFADLDNDGWQDLYVSNGYSLDLWLGNKVFYHNKGDGSFEDKTNEFGMEDYSNTAAYSYVDYDHDGDLDIIAVPMDGPVKIFKNNNGELNNSIQIVLQDFDSKNSGAIGAKIIIGNQLQIIKASGGYKSFDALVANFGLGKKGSVNNITIIWPDGRKDVVEGEFKAGGRYRISRKT